VKRKKIYAIISGDYVKIGVSANPVKRLQQLKTASPTTLRLLCFFDGDEKLEKEMHQDLERYRTFGGGKEWFTYNEKVDAVIKSYAGGNSIDTSKKYLEAKYGVKDKHNKNRLKKCKKCSSFMRIKENGETKKKFWGCNIFPKCNYAEPITGNDIIGCRKCENGVMKIRKGRSGVFLGCSNYPKCNAGLKI